MIRPTFTYPIASVHDPSAPLRRHKDKRTPSWTDRVLWRGQNWVLSRTEQNHSNCTNGRAANGYMRIPQLACFAERRVQCSDHEAILVTIEGPPLKPFAPRRPTGSFTTLLPYLKSTILAVFVGGLAFSTVLGSSGIIGFGKLTESLLFGCTAFAASMFTLTGRRQ